MEKKINYLARSYEDIKSELLKFSKMYYPELSESFNDASVGAWLVDLVSVLGDNLSYHTDRMYQETNVDSATSKSSILNAARLNGVKVPGPKASMCEVELSCVLPLDSTNISIPNWNYAPVLKIGTVVGNSQYHFETIEDVDFGEQFNADGISNRKYEPVRNNNGIITAYTVTKTTLVMGGQNKIYKKVIADNDVEPFMEVVLPEKDVMNVESVIFKESLNYSKDPQSYEYYIDEERYHLNNEEIDTYRFFEVDSLSDQYIFATKSNEDGLTKGFSYPNIMQVDEDCYDKIIIENNGTTDKSISFPIRRYFKGQWKPITQKFITEYTDNGYLKLIFGSGNEQVLSLDAEADYSQYAQYRMTKIMNNDLLGVLPRVGWTMFILYRTGGGTNTNLGPGSINTVINAKIFFKSTYSGSTKITQSLKVNNVSPSIGGKDMPNTEEIKFLTKYANGSQNRCVTLKDYKSRVLMIPPKYGCPFRINAVEDNNKIIIACLGLKPNGKLDDGLSNVMQENLQEYISQYKNLGDYVEFRSGKIFNLGFEVNVFIDKTYVAAEVIKNVINTVSSYFDVNTKDMGQEIFIGDLEKNLNLVDGVLGLIELKVYAIYGGMHQNYIPSLPRYVEYTSNCGSSIDTFKVSNDEGAKSFRVDLNAIDGVLTNDYDSMYEIHDINTDIQVKAKIR